MKAGIYQGKEKIEIIELPDPVCTDDGVILQNVYASICGTDVAAYKHGTGLGHKISDKVAALIEPFTVGCRAARRGMPKSGENAIVFGAGTIGIGAAIALKHFGCDKVMVCDYSDFRLSKVKELGFEICNNGKDDLIKRSMEYFGKAYGYKGETSNVVIKY